MRQRKPKVQISIRIDRELMESTYRAIEGTEVRITDLFQRGLVLAIQELRRGKATVEIQRALPAPGSE